MQISNRGGIVVEPNEASLADKLRKAGEWRRQMTVNQSGAIVVDPHKDPLQRANPPIKQKDF